MQNLERYAIDISCWVRNLGSRDDHMQCGKNRIKREWIWFYGVSKRMGRLVVRLKAIKYNENSFCNLSF